MAMLLHGYVTMLLHGYVTMLLYGYVTTWLCYYVTTWLCYYMTNSNVVTKVTVFRRVDAMTIAGATVNIDYRVIFLW